MANWSNPTLTSLYTDFVTEVKNRDVDLALGLDPATTSPTNVPTNAIRWNSASFKYQKWDGSTWNDLSTKYIFTAVEVSGSTVPVNGMYLSTTNTLNFSTASTASRLTIDGSGNVNIDSGTFYVDAVNNRVGVGTTGPSQALHLKGSGDVKLLINSTNNASDRGIYFAASTDSDVLGYIKQEYSTGKFEISSGSGTYASSINFRTGGTADRLVLDASGNLGLGVTPSAWGASFKVLDFAGASFASNTAGTATFIAQNAYYDFAWKYKSSTNATLFQTDSGSFQWYTSTNTPSVNGAITFTQAMTLDASGKLGIGTTNIRQALTFGNLTSTSTATPDSIDLGATYTSTTASTNLKLKLYTDSSGNTYGFTVNGSSQLEYYAGTVSSPGSHVFLTGGSERARLDASGNLGLGVVPSAWGAAWKAYQYVGGSIASPNGNNNLILQNAYNDGTGYKYTYTGAATYYQQSAGQHIWVNAPSGTAGAAITFTQAMTLDASGRLLVGTTSTSATTSLLVQGSNGGAAAPGIIRACYTTATPADGITFGYLVFGDSAHADAAWVAAARDGGTWSASSKPTRLVFSTTADGAGSPTERMRIDNLGYMQGTVNGLSAGRIPAKQYYRLNTARTGSISTTAQSIFGVGVTLVGSTVYEFEGIYHLSGAYTTLPSSCEFHLLFGGTATLNNIMYMGSGPGLIEESTYVNNYSTSADSFYSTVATSVRVVDIVAADVSVTYFIKGTVSVNAAGTFIPQYRLTQAPTTAFTTRIGSYFSIWPLGASGANTSIGDWA